MNTKVIFYSLLTVMLVLAGCSSGQTGPTNLDPYIGGTEGLEMEFITGTPPAEVFDKGSFAISVRLLNSGEYDIEEGKGFVDVKGLSPNAFGVSKDDLKVDIPDILGARKNSDSSVLKGQSAVVSFGDLSYQSDLKANFPIETLRVRACYDYGTESLTTLCIKEKNTDGLKDSELCQVSQDKNTANSAAPIQVVGLTQTSRYDRGIQVSFDVAHVGPIGNKWFPEGDVDCDDSISNTDLYAVDVEVGPIINDQYVASCTGGSGSFNSGNTGTVTLYQGEPATVICTFDIGDQEADFQTPVNIDLKYRYLESIDTSLLIKNLPGD